MKTTNILAIAMGLFMTVACSQSNELSELNSEDGQEISSAERPHGDMGHSKFRDMDPAEMAEKMTERMSEKLDLDEGQKVEVKAIITSFAQEMKVLRSQERSKEKMMAFKELAETNKAKMKEVLNAEQYEKFEAFMGKMKKKFMKGKHGKGGRTKSKQKNGRM